MGKIHKAKIQFIIVLLTSALLLSSVRASATQPLQGFPLQQPPSCLSYQQIQVPYILNRQLNNVGIATSQNGRPVIIINPDVITRFSPLVQIWWYAHECGHHALLPTQNSEINADCFAARSLRSLGYIQNYQSLAQLMAELSTLPGNMFSGHLPGHQRAQLVANCANNW